jgi:Ring finger domain
MNMRLDFAASPPTFPIPQPSPRDLRPAFNPNSWPSGTIQNPPMFQQIAIQPTDQTQGSSSWSPWTDAHPRYSSREHTALHQSQLYEHNRLLLTQRAQLAASTQRRAVDCGVCMDTFLEESIARIQPCGHPFCRDCVRRHVVSQMETRRFPVLCPTCTAEPGHKSKSIGSRCRYVGRSLD